MTTKESTALDIQQVSNFLRQNPEFFNEHPSLLEEIKLEHDSGNAISLVEKQLSVLRERNQDMRHRMDKLLANARVNDQLFEKSKRLVLTLLEAQDVGDMIDAIFFSLKNEFNIPYTALILFGEPRTLSAGAKQVTYEMAEQQFKNTLTNNRSFCGNLNQEEAQFLFGDKASKVGSAAIVPLNHGDPIGLLAIGHKDPKHFRSSMGTLFLSHIGDVLARLLAKHR